ncbi:hypothetical protein SAMCCGM7_pC1200 (plasmid) [Sinorhizobium americanum CCGM7]|nr:hypothetical protein SAMCCGM7_pC1200 [Sinorhizobium americanum CCGM7]
MVVDNPTSKKKIPRIAISFSSRMSRERVTFEIRSNHLKSNFFYGLSIEPMRNIVIDKDVAN